MNIVWMRPDRTIAVTMLTDEFALAMSGVADCLTRHAADLQKSGRVPSDWSAVGFDVVLPTARYWREAWVWSGTGIDVSLQLAREITKARLRTEREPLLGVLDVQFQRNLEIGADNSSIVAEKNRLRNITELVDSAASINDLASISCAT